jgi:hypothetical protein
MYHSCPTQDIGKQLACLVHTPAFFGIASRQFDHDTAEVRILEWIPDDKTGVAVLVALSFALGDNSHDERVRIYSAGL